MNDDRYSDFAQLAAQEWESTNYQLQFTVSTESSKVIKIRARVNDSKVLIMAPHGGEIEDFTSELAEQIAGERFSLYLFEGLKDAQNRDLHITSTKFDEPQALKALKRADLVLTVHGEGTKTKEFVIVGGLADEVIAQIKTALQPIGISLPSASDSEFPGTNPCNLCNRGRLGKGVQLELSRGLRDTLEGDEQKRRAFTTAIAKVLEKYRELD